jgi:predicted nuclease with TOPRIM domain
MRKDVAEEMMDLKEDIQEKIKEKERIKGKRQQLMQRVQEVFKCNTIKALKRKRDKMEMQYNKLEKRISKELDKIEEEYNVHN